MKERCVYTAGGTKGTSACDVSISAQLMIERGLDTHSNFGIASSDIAIFFDKTPLGKLGTKLCHRVEPVVAAAANRLHARPQIILSIFGQECKLPPRRLGLTTGSSSAAMLQRVPVEDCLEAILDTAKANAAEFSGEKFSLAFWSDNVFAFGRSAWHACSTQKALEEHLSEHWAPLTIAKDSKECLVLPGSGEDLDSIEEMGFKKVDTMRILGPILAANGSSEPLMSQIHDKVMAAYFANSTAATTKLAPTDRVRLFNNASQGVIAWAGAQLVWSEVNAKKVDKLQHSVHQRLCPFAKPADML